MNASIFCEFASADEAIAAATLLRARGIDRLEAYMPYGVPELEALSGKRSRIPLAVLIGGVVGGLLAFGIIYYCNAYDYPLDVGGRPLNSLPADIPIIFETVVLFASLTAFFGVLLRSGLPRLAHPLFDLDGFEQVSIDRFWIGIDVTAADASVVEDAVRELAPRVVRRLRDAS